MKARMSKQAEKLFNERPNFSRKLLRSILTNPTKVANHEAIHVTDVETGVEYTVKQM